MPAIILPARILRTVGSVDLKLPGKLGDIAA